MRLNLDAVSCWEPPSSWRRVRTDGSYLSSNDMRVHFGLGDRSLVEGIVVEWRDGEREVWRNVAPNAFVRLVQGSGEAAP